MKMIGLNTGRAIMGIALMLLALNTQAQRGVGMNQRGPAMMDQRGAGMHQGKGFMADSGLRAHNMMNLTDEQQKKIAELRTAHQKEMTSLRNDLAIKRAELQKYQSADKPDMTVINKTIDEIGKITTDMQKKSVAHNLAVRGLLTEEQKAAFDTRGGRYGAGKGSMHGVDRQGYGL